MKFEYPLFLWLLLVLPPALAAFFWWTWRRQQRLMAQFVEARLLAALTAGVSLTRRRIRWACLIAAAASLIVTLARPQWGFTWEETRQRGLDIVIAIDTSKSMLAEDIAPNRLARAKLAALDLLQQAKSDRLGLVAFAGGAFLQCPLTIDDAVFRQCLDALDVNIIPQGGTAVAEAIQTATTAFKRDNDNYKVLVLFTDGEDNDAGAPEAATKAEKAGLKIFTVGIGTTEGELLRVKDAKGRTDYVRDEQGNVVKSHLNEALLQQIAGAAGGFYLPLRGAKTIDTLYEKGLAPLPKSESKERLVKRYHERFYWPLAIAILLLLVEMLFPERKRETRNEILNLKAASRIAIVALALPVVSCVASASPSSALRDYRSGKYEDALKEYKQLLDKKGDDPRLRFNAGTSAYRDGQFNEAAKHFGDVLAAPDLQLQQHAYYNLGNTFFQIGQNTVDPAKRTEAWEKALKDYESTLKLNPQDADAKFNHAFVKKKLEELKQQQQQQQQQNQDKKDQQKDQDKQDQQQQQNQQKQQDPQKDESQQQQKESEQKQQDQKQQEQKQQEQQQQAQKDQQQKQDSQPSQAWKDQDKKDQQSAQSRQQKEQPSKEDEQTEAAQAYAGQMTPQQARQLLDAQKAGEAMISIKPEGKPIPANRPFKDW